MRQTGCRTQTTILVKRLGPERHAAAQLHAGIVSWLQGTGSTQTKSETISRADFAFDFHVPEIDFDEDWFVSRATKDAKWRENNADQSFQFGKGDIVVRVYDKAAEIEQQSGKSWFFDLWGRKTNVWRIEFQVRGPRLKEGGIRTLGDLDAFGADLLRELARNHTTLRKPNGDKNRSRWPLHPLWEALVQAIDSLPQTGLVATIDPANELAYCRERQLKSLYGNG